MSVNVSNPLSIGGERITGENVRKQNVLAVSSIANIIKTSLGPLGLDKMLVDDVGEITISNDGATILDLLEVEHPAGKILVELARLQDKEVGDGTTSVVILAAELLKLAEAQVSARIHPTTLLNGYHLACKEACKFIRTHLAIDVNKLGTDCIINAAKTSMSSKLIGVDSDFFAKMAVDAAMAVRIPDNSGGGKKSGGAGWIYPTGAINVLKAHGKSMRESRLINGYALNCTIASQQMPRCIRNAKIALLDFNLQKLRLKLGVQVLVTDPDKLDAIRRREADVTKERIQKILASGANVVLTTGGIDDLCLKYFVEAKVMAVRRCKRVDLKRIAKATGGTLVSSLAQISGGAAGSDSADASTTADGSVAGEAGAKTDEMSDGDDAGEHFDPAALGHADEVMQERVCDDELILLKGPRARSAASIILRGANDFYVDEMERSLHDALCVVKRVMESRQVVAGGGACEVATAIFLENYSMMISSREQIAVAEYARALLSIPKQLAVNAAMDSTELLAQLRAIHHEAQQQRHVAQQQEGGAAAEEEASANAAAASSKSDLAQSKMHFGLDLINRCVTDNLKAGVLEPMMSKVRALKYATEAAVTVLRIDDLVKLHEEPKQGRGDE